MQKDSNPCFGCVPPERQIGCHVWCKKFLDWTGRENERKAKIAKERAITSTIHSICKEGSKKPGNKLKHGSRGGSKQGGNTK